MTYDQVLRFILNAADPYTLSDEALEKTVWPYLRSHLHPLRRVLIASVVVTVLAAGVEVWLIQYAGQLIDKFVISTP